MPGRADDRHERARAARGRSRGTGPSAGGSPRDGRRTAPRAPRSGCARLARQRRVCARHAAHRDLLALERLLAGLLERDRRHWPPGASPRRPARCPGVPPTGAGGGVDQVAGDHALVGRTDRDRRLAGQHAGAGLDAGPSERTRRRPARARHAPRARRHPRAAVGAPQTAITASPMNFSTVPPYRSITSRARSK